MLAGRPLVETTCATFAGHAEQVRSARRFITDALGEDWPRLDDVLLLASEVASNAVKHTASGDGGHFDVLVAVFTAMNAVRVAIADQGGPAEPAIFGAPDDSDGPPTAGRGLHIVDALADRWGHRGDELGRLVWFEITTKPEDCGDRASHPPPSSLVMTQANGRCVTIKGDMLEPDRNRS